MTRLSGDFMCRARVDGRGVLMESQEPLAGLQLACGGSLPGELAIGELREAVFYCLSSKTRVTRKFTAFDGENAIEAWVDLVPQTENDSETAHSCIIGVSEWNTMPAEFMSAEAEARNLDAVNINLAELTARLDEDQCVLAVDGHAPDILPAVAAMRASLGKPWTDHVNFPGNGHRQPLHWRLLDGAMCTIKGSSRDWHVTLVESKKSSANLVGGFELYLTPKQILSPKSIAVDARERDPATGVTHSIGRELAPVLRRPIARIIANAETIRTRMAGPLADEYSAYAADITHAGRHLMSLLDDLADLEVVESEGFTTAPDDIDLADVVRRAAGIVGVRAQEKAITLRLPDENTHVRATAEFRRVLQILLNLIGNAIRYAPSDSEVFVEISYDNARARLTVRDQGPGIAQEYHESVFQKFERLGRSGDGGSGLGLYISRRIARALGGDLRVESVVGQGACFILDLPPA